MNYVSCFHFISFLFYYFDIKMSLLFMSRFKKHKTKLLCIIVLVISYSIIYLYLLVSHNKQERINFIKNFDIHNNETNYIYLDTNYKFINYKRSISKVEMLRRKVKKLNTDVVASNPELVPLDSITIVILVQVHNRIEYLAEVIESLSKVRGITRSILIFSHDYYDKDINALIKQITFTTYLQIFYPYSKQLYPEAYPGEDPKYCSKDWKCVPNKGQRNATLTQVKLHWWWKVNFVFNNIGYLRDYDGLLLFLEDDQYVTEDLIYTAKLVEGISAYECPECYMISVAADRPQIYNYHLKNPMTIEEFGTTPHNMGIAFNRSSWNTIKKYGEHFCRFDDFSWTNSLRFLSNKMPHGKIYMFSVAGPRVFHIGRCGLLTPGTDCDVTHKLEFLKRYLQLVYRGLFPENYELKSSHHPKTKIVEYGNFSDIRDHELCKYFCTNANYGMK